MSEEKCYQHTVRLNRLLNIQKKQTLIVIGVLLLFWAYTIVLTFIEDSYGIKDAIISTLIIAVLITGIILGHPKYLKITPDTIRFKSNTLVFSFLINGRFTVSANDESRYEEAYVLYNIRSIEYLQTPLEKLFSCGHLRVLATTNLRKKSHQQDFVIYGVTDFENTADMIRGFVNLKPQEQ